jgi:hypothetical protein
MGESPFHYVDALYHLYLINQNNDTFSDATITVARLQKSIRRYQDTVLQLTGVDKEWARCEEIGTCVSNVLKALEDVLCHGMGDLNDLIAIHSRGELLYQTLPSA